MTEAEIAELLGQSVEKIETQLGALDDAALTAVHDAEDGGKARATLLAAIARVRDARAAEAAAAGQVDVEQVDDGDDADDGDGAPLAQPSPQRGEGELAADAAVEAMANRLDALARALIERGHGPTDDPAAAPWDATLEAIRVIDALSADFDRLQDALAAAEKKAWANRAPKVRPGREVRVKADARADAEDPVAIVFVGDGDIAIAALGQLAFLRSQFATGGGAIVLQQKIDLPTDAPRCEVHGAWVLDGHGRAIARAGVGMVPLNFGGGTGALIAAGSLRFALPVPAAAPAKAG